MTDSESTKHETELGLTQAIKIEPTRVEAKSTTTTKRNNEALAFG